MPKPDLHACPYTEAAFRMLGKRWMGLIIDVLLQRPARFNELARAIPQLSKRMLDERLTELAENGLVARIVDPGPPLAVTYHLTPRGHGLKPALEALRAWAATPDAGKEQDA
jgi:DNA-binding HxlR family transcriptional regulator